MVHDPVDQNNLSTGLGNVHTFVMSIASRGRFVGRADELARLDAALAAAADRSPGAVLIGGEAGVGKSRLVTEFSTRARGGGALVLTGSCFDLSAGGLPYGPIVEALRRLDRTVDATTRRHITGPAQTELARLLSVGDATRAWLGDAPATGSAQARTFELLLQFLGRLSASTPVVVVVEDVHWADRTTLDLLTFLLRNLFEERVLLVVTYRSEELQGRHAVRAFLAELDRIRRTDRMELQSFSAEELAELLVDIVGAQETAPLVDRIFARSGGNPFFAEELLAAGMGQGDTPIPPKLRDVIMARVEALSPDAQEILRVIAATGRRVSHRLVAAVSELSEQALLEALREAVGQHFLVGDTGTGTYVFRHALMREAIYADLLPGELIRLHTLIAKALAEDAGRGGHEGAVVAAELAHHWHAANNLPQALAASIEAGSSAANVYAFAEARRQFERALELWRQVAEEARLAGLSRDELLEETAKVTMQAGDIERALGHVREALADVDPTRQPTRASLLQQRLGFYLWRLGDSGGSLAAHAAADRLLAGHPASPERAQVLASYGSALMIAGRYSAARVRSEEAISIARTVGAVQQEGYALNALGVSLTMLGDPEAGIDALLRACSMAEAAESFEDTYRAYGNLSFAFENAGRLEEAAEAALHGLALARPRHLELVAGAVLLNAADYLFRLGRWREAEDLLGSTPRLATSPRFGPEFQTVQAELAMATGRFDEAAAHLRAARQMSPNLHDPYVVGPLHAALAELAIWQRNPDAAKAAVRDGLQLIAESEASALPLRLCAIGIRAESDKAEHGRLTHTAPQIEAARQAGATLLGKARELSQALSRRGPVPPEARAWALVCEAEHARLQAHVDPTRWQAAAEAWEELRLPYRAAQARWRHAEALVADGAGEEASAPLQQALATAGRLDAGPLRERLQRLARQATQPTASGAEPRRW